MLWDSVNNGCDSCHCSIARVEQCCNPFHTKTCEDKENVGHNQRLGSPMKQDSSDLSFYSTSSPPRTISPGRCMRRVLEDHDPNSQDSGYSASCPTDGNKFFQFARSLGVTPSSMPSQSFSSLDSMEEDFLEYPELEPMDENAQLPADFVTLLNCPVATQAAEDKTVQSSPPFVIPIRTFRRSVSLNDSNTPSSSRVRSCLFKTEDSPDFRSFKRPEPPAEHISPISNKRSKVALEAEVPQSNVRPVLRRSFSATEESIKCALQRSATDPDLIGDFSKSFCLPVTTGRHRDLKSITANTLAMLMSGDYSESVDSFKVVDCRYPYEFDGGHIEGAHNMYTKEQVIENLLDNAAVPTPNTESVSRHILVFHCEFSSERGPNLYRFLRNLDRTRNNDAYPALHYPEMYILEGGYKNFFEQFPKLCVPEDYKPMLHPEHASDLRFFRSKSKSFNSSKRVSGSSAWKRMSRI